MTSTLESRPIEVLRTLVARLDELRDVGRQTFDFREYELADLKWRMALGNARDLIATARPPATPCEEHMADIDLLPCPPQVALSEGELGGIAYTLFKRLGGTDWEWSNKPRLHDTWTQAVDELLACVAKRRSGLQVRDELHATATKAAA